MQTWKVEGYIIAAAATVLCSSIVEAAESVTYTYDSLGRLIDVLRSGSINSGVEASYNYDLADNRSQVIVRGGPTVTDPSFELPSIGSGYVYTPTTIGVSFNGGAGVAGDGSPWGFVSAPDGSQVAFLQSGGIIDQTVSNLVPGCLYRVTFAAAQRPGFGANIISVSVNGSLLFAAAPSSSSVFTRYLTSNFRASASTATVHFAAQTTTSDTASGIDAVAVEGVQC